MVVLVVILVLVRVPVLASILSFLTFLLEVELSDLWCRICVYGGLTLRFPLTSFPLRWLSERSGGPFLVITRVSSRDVTTGSL